MNEENQGERHELTVKLQSEPRRGPSPDPAYMAAMWQHWLEPQLSRTVQVFPCPGSREELVVTWRGGTGYRHAYRFRGAVVLPTRDTVVPLARALQDCASGQEICPRALLVPELLTFEQAAHVLQLLVQRAAALPHGEIVVGEGAVPPAERGSFLQGIVDKLSKGKPSASMQARVDAFKAEQVATLPPELTVADGPVRSPNPEPRRVEVVRRPLPEPVEVKAGEVLWRDLVPDGPHPVSPRRVGREVVEVHRAVVAYVVEAPEPVTLPAGGASGNEIGLPANQPWVVVSPEASLRALEHLHSYLDTEIRHRKAVQGDRS